MPIEPLSAVSAIATLVVTGVGVGLKANEFYGHSKDCPARVRSVGTDVDNTIAILMQLNRAFGNPAGADIFSVQGTEEQFEGVVSGPERTLDDLLKHVKKFENMDERSATGRVWKTMRWAASPMEEAEQLSAELARHKGSLGIFLQLAQR